MRQTTASDTVEVKMQNAFMSKIVSLIEESVNKHALAEALFELLGLPQSQVVWFCAKNNSLARFPASRQAHCKGVRGDWHKSDVKGCAYRLLVPL